MIQTPNISPSVIDTVRQFNRFYTHRIGLLNESVLDSEFSLTEARIAYELDRNDGITATALGGTLGLDAGYLSRILKKFEQRGLIARTASPTDARQNAITLTDHGEQAFSPLSGKACEFIATMFVGLSPSTCAQVAECMHTIMQSLDPRIETPVPYILRFPEPGDFGWIIHRQAALYHQEYGFDETFEGLIAEIIGSFVANFNPAQERCWVAERNDEVAGSVFCTKVSDEVAKLRLLYVDPSARGLGIGGRLVDEVIKFARNKNYKVLKFWTNDILVSARRIYEAAGFELIKEEAHHSFGQDLIGQDWQMKL